MALLRTLMTDGLPSIGAPTVEVVSLAPHV
jgi:hypothetical protein